jgi:electron transport complex protein RnfG
VSEQAAPAPPIMAMYRALVGIGMLCGMLIAVVFTTTAPIIERNRSEALERAVFDVLPTATQRRTYRIDLFGDLVPVREGDDTPAAEQLHAGFDANGTLVGFAIEASGMGYADRITLLYGYSPAGEAIVGIRVLASKETPGLGDRIENDADFLANFEALDARLNTARTAPANRIVTVKHGQKTQPWEIDGITGATVSSKAVGEILGASTDRWLAKMHDRWQQLTPAEDRNEARTP